MPFRPTCPLSSHKLPPSSRAWLARQFRDPYVKARLSFPANYRSRSAFKLIELDNTFHFLSEKHVNTVIDLGAAPGGWSQVVAGKLGWADWDPLALGASQGGSSGLSGQRAKSQSQARKAKNAGRNAHQDQGEEGQDDYIDLDSLDPGVEVQRPVGRGTIIAVDLLRMEPIPGVKTLQMDFLSPEAEQCINALLTSQPGSDGKADVVLSDMAANFTGNSTADVHASLQLSESVFEFVKRHLRTAESVGKRKAGVLLLKHFAHPSAEKFRKRCLDPNFNLVKYCKPSASRAESAEAYWLCMGWKGVQPTRPPEPTEAEQPAS
ncbi:23S ribosomal RNA methyltransferase [Trametes punicea]|nr:23S ribosomal RNA methyltransferase [Trametes punicea]